MCTPRQTAFTRSKWDDVHQADDMRITSYAGTYAFTPYKNCPASFPMDTTTRIQQSGASWVSGLWKTEVESDLMGVGRPSARWREDSLLYNPMTNVVNQKPLEHAPDESSPLVFNHLTNPPCTLRATGWNRWDFPIHNPQETFETPFDFFIPARDVDKYRFRTHTPARGSYTDEVVKGVATQQRLQ
jgi:hypothetical protein